MVALQIEVFVSLEFPQAHKIAAMPPYGGFTKTPAGTAHVSVSVPIGRL